MADRPASPAAPATPEKANAPGPSADGNARPESKPETGAAFPSYQIAVIMHECQLDSPSYRSAVRHFDDQLDMFEKWLSDLIKGMQALLHTAGVFEESLGSMADRLLPTFDSELFFDTDYTLKALHGFGEQLRTLAQPSIKQIKYMSDRVFDPLHKFQSNELRQMRELRRAYIRAFEAFEAADTRHYGMSKTKEVSAIRESAFQLYELRKQYVHASFDLAEYLPSFRNSIDLLVVNCASLAVDNAVFNLRSALLEIERETALHKRTLSWLNEVEKRVPGMQRDLNVMRTRLEGQVVEATRPTRDLKNYAVNTLTAKARNLINAHVSDEQGQTTPVNREGYLYVRQVGKTRTNYVWQKRWYYLRRGVFGWLAVGRRNVVEEGEKIGVLLCNISMRPQEDRRFCFEVMTKQFSVILQAGSESELRDWVEDFERSKREVISAKDWPQAFIIAPPTHEEFAAEGHIQDGVVVASDAGMARQSSDISRPRASSQVTRQPQPQGIGALVNATGTALAPSGTAMRLPSIGQPRIINTHGPEVVVVTSFAPMSFAPAPLVTAHTGKAYAARSFSISDTSGGSNIPSGAVANYWGSQDWAASASKASKIDGDLIAAAGQQNLATAAGTLVDKRDSVPSKSAPEAPSIDSEHELAPNSIASVQDYPSRYPLELRKNDVQFHALFCGAGPGEHVITVFRAVLSRAAQMDISVSGRIYITANGLYFYGKSFDTVNLKEFPFSEILDVQTLPGKSCDYLILEVYGFGFVIFRVYLDDVQVARKRISYLLQNFLSEKPLSSFQAFNHILDYDDVLMSTESTEQEESEKPSVDGTESPWYRGLRDHEDESLPDDVDLHRKQQAGNDDVHLAKSTHALHHHIHEVGRHHYKSEPVRFKLPSMPVKVPREIHLEHILDSIEYDVSAQCMFHILFGDNSGIWQLMFNLSGSVDTVQNPWYHLENERLLRSFDVTCSYKNHLGVEKRTQIHDTQTIDRRNEHILYVATLRHEPWQLPFCKSFDLLLRISIAFVSKGRCKVTKSYKVQFRQPIFGMQRVLERASVYIINRVSTELNGLLSQEVSKLGQHAKKSRAIRIYGRVGALRRSRRLTSQRDSQTGSITVQTIGMLVYKDMMMFVLGIFNDCISQASRVFSMFANVIDANRFIVLLLILSFLGNLTLTTRSTVAYWTERHADKILSDLRISALDDIMGWRAIYSADLDDYIRNQYAFKGNGSCFQAFEASTSRQDPARIDSVRDVSPQSEQLSALRQDFASLRFDHVVAIKTLDNLEREAVRGQYLAFVQRERRNCERVHDSTFDVPPDVIAYCDSCEREFEHVWPGDVR